jgi:hypothetical protein
VAGIGFGKLLAGSAEWLAWARACPPLGVIRDAGEPECIGPSSNSGEEMALSEFRKVVWLYIGNAPFIYFTR